VIRASSVKYSRAACDGIDANAVSTASASTRQRGIDCAARLDSCGRQDSDPATDA